jgi:hypothetical protein
MAYLNNYFDDNLTFNNNLNTQSDSNDIECISCTKSTVKPLRCKCCNERININDLINYLTTKYSGITKATSDNKNLLKINLKSLNSICKYMKPNAVIYGTNFSYDIEYMTNDITDVKIVNRIEIKEKLENFNSSSLPIQSLLMHDCAVNNNNSLFILVNLNQFNI